MKFDDKALLAQKAEKLEKFLQELTEKIAEKPTLIVIGGFAVRAHGSKRFSHDGDIMVDYRTHGELRDQFTLFRNPRLGKEQFLTPFGADVDVFMWRTNINCGCRSTRFRPSLKRKMDSGLLVPSTW